MTLYLDTSLLVAALTIEKNTARAEAWVAGKKDEFLAISDWVIAEFSSALSIKLRVGAITPNHRADALATFAQLWAESLIILPIASPHFRTAARFSDQHALGLRASDALHLAICLDHGATLCTLDRRLGHAGIKLGVQTKIL